MFRQERKFKTVFAATVTFFLATMVFGAPVRAEMPTTSPTTTASSSAPPATKAPRVKQNVVARMEEKLTTLQNQLKLTDTQKVKWNSYAETARGNVKAMREMVAQRHQTQTPKTALDAFRSRQQIAEARAEGARKLTSAFEALYASLSDDQKKIADAAIKERKSQHRKPKTS